MDYYGIDLHSYSHGLLGSQGWSPDSSMHSDDGNDMVSSNQLQKMSVEFPLPPLRYKTTRPLSLSSQKIKAGRAVSARVEPMIHGLDNWNLDLEDRADAMDSDIMNYDAFGIFTAKKKNKSTAMQIEIPALNRRIFSAPPPPAYLEMQDLVDESPAQEPEEYPFPFMNRPRNPFQHPAHIGMEEEKNKMRRLNDSLSLLHISPKCTELDSWKRGSIGMSPLQRLSQSAVLSPEHGAPSLQEQMAFASGLGDRYSWSSPSKMTRSSSSSHYLPGVAQPMTTTNSQDERRMASRHVRQGVAANGSAPLPKSVSMQTALSGMEAEVGSSWSHKGCDEEGDEDFDDEESDEGQHWLEPAQTPMDRSSFSQQSCLTSTICSINSSPILHGVLSARDFAICHHSHLDLSSSGEGNSISPSTCASSIQSASCGQSIKEVDVEGLFTRGLAVEYGDSESCSGSSEGIPTPVDTPNSLHEFSYILDSDEFVASPIDSVNVFGNDGFDGNTFSPSIGTPDMEDFPPTPIGFAPSPVMDQSSIEPHPSLMQSSPSSALPATFSTLSVLERPRPVIRSATTTSFFGKGDAELQLQRMSASTSTPSLKKMYEERRPSVPPISSATTSSSPVNIPGRKSSLEIAFVLTPSGIASDRISFDIPHDDEDLKKRRRRNLSVSFSMDLETPHRSAESFYSSQPEVIPVGILTTTSSSVGNGSTAKMSPKALAQVREACRAKADLVRNITLENLEAEERKKEAANRIIKQQLEAEKRQHTMIRSGASEPANLHLNIFSKKVAGQQQSSVSVKSIKSSSSSFASSSFQSQESSSGSSSSSSSSSAKHSKQKSISPTSSTLSVSNHMRPKSGGNVTFALPDSVKVILPTVFVARTDSQRQRGWTGVPETEPDTLAIIKRGGHVKIATRQSKVEALIHNKSDVQEQGALLNMPHGVVLIVEEKKIHESIIPV